MNSFTHPYNATFDDASHTRSYEITHPAPPGEPIISGILTATCDVLPASNCIAIVSRTTASSANGADHIDTADLGPAKSHPTTEVGASAFDSPTARSVFTIAVDRSRPPLFESQLSEAGDETSHSISSTGSGSRAVTPEEIAWSEMAHNGRFRVSQHGETFEGDEEHQVDSCVVIPATIDRSEQLDISPAFTSSAALSGYPDSERKNLRTQFPSEPSSSYPVSPLAEVTEAFTNSQGGWGLPLSAPGPYLGHQYFDQGTDRRSIKSKKPLKSRNVDDKGKENIPIAATHRHRTGTRGGNHSPADTPSTAVRRGPLRI
ncbi:hypothetical protein MJO28_002427 [Puccinia striiformis f. sp. tritici]|uniref:Uncharacterized protein n=1 Tax=Puccinia striiformis f. sp. tritici TaxID=168172 RepID=A0ACC0ERY6_9BASI|nr:hypothetical protein Pst134EB_006670 [Puccinia striiformis f. sp. tritici]KAI7934150.1 hypothetical protein MJO29_016581 [Puccinia striiformis f. sp. tritici]KAI7958636.1 hypothetical protein MJO28_002427 [Puccinia striiformis f. sp. tritici]KAI9628520.1 hypothetical protein KEM48_011475 [Puccinia striiformis f. sp. tritici PST-130]